MNQIECIDICKSYGDKKIVKNLSLTINEGEKLILLGPSGCGKTTTLRMIAGLESITSGSLRMGGVEVNDLAAGERNVAMVFQNYALLPHLTVWENITFGLRLRKMNREEIEKRADEALEILNLTDYRNAKPKELSGGQKQRVALGRAIVKQSPYFLLDEPLSNLDAKLRYQARTELLRLHNLYKPTMVYVTHDQVEAMSLADRIAILKDGVLQQLGTPQEVYNRPATIFVATFIGSPAMNVIKVKREGDSIWVGEQRITIPSAWRRKAGGREQFYLGIRPEDCSLVKEGASLQGEIENVENLGNQKILHFILPDQQKLAVSVRAEEEVGQQIAFDWSKVNVFDSETGVNLCMKGGAN